MNRCSIPWHLVGLIISISLLLGGISPIAAAAPQPPAIDFDTVVSLPPEWQEAVTLALGDGRLAPTREQMVVTSFELAGDWIHVVLTPRHIIDAHWEIAFSWDEIIEVLGQRTENGRRTAYLLNSQGAAALKSLTPAHFMTFTSPAQAQGSASAPASLLPWTSGQVWSKTQGWHSGYWGFANNAIDIAPSPGSSNQLRDYAVLAPTSGRITRVCEDNGDQAVLKLESELGIFGYLHVRNSSIPGGVLNQDVPRGRYLGYLYDTGGSFSSYCGYGTGVHLHFTLPSRDTTIDGNSADNIANARNGQGYQSSNQRTDSNTAADNDGGTLGYGESRSGSISPAYDYDDFYFNAAANDTVEIRLDKNNSSLDTLVVLKGPDNQYLAEDDDAGDGTNSFLRRTLTGSGRYHVLARGYGSSTGAYTLRINRVVSCSQDCQGDPRWIAFGQTLDGVIDSNGDSDTYFFNGTGGRAVKISMNRTGGGLDAFVELYNANGVRINSNDDSGGNQNSLLTHTLPADGTYRILARSFSSGSSGSYSVRLESLSGNGAGNLARGKGVWVSSVEFAGVEGWRATDGSTGTRWSSQFSDPQQIYVDLGQDRTFNQVVLKWESAYGKRFGIYYWDGGQWRNVYWTNDGRGGTNTINFNPVRARFVSMYGIERGTQWGYSLWEFEVYDTTTTTMPLVPPDDPTKVDTTTGIAPLAPVEGDKAVLATGDGAYGQEETPLADPGSATPVTTEVSATQSVVAFILEPSDLGRHGDIESTAITFSGDATSQVSGNAVPIVAYRWRSDRQGEIGAQASFTLPVSALLPGTHTIYFRAQNEQGAWSEEVSTPLVVVWPHKVSLPMIAR